MTASDRTPEFRGLLRDVQNTIPEAKRRKLSGKRVGDAQREGQDALSKEYLAEAYAVVCRYFPARSFIVLSMCTHSAEPYHHFDSNAVLHS